MTGEPMKALLGILGIARRARVLLIGQDIVKSSLARGDSLLILFAGDKASSFFRSLGKGRYAEKCSVHVLSGISADDLSAALGMGNVQVAALPLRSGFARKVVQLLAEGGEKIE